MLLLLSLLLLMPSTLCSPARGSKWHGRIISMDNATLTASCGISTTARDNPWSAIVYWDNVFQCGATLLETNIAITSAHCVIGKRKDLFLVYYGTTFQPDTKIRDQGAVDFGGNSNVMEIRIHPNYDPERKFKGFDLAILKLTERITFNELVTPISVVPTQPKYNALLEDGAPVQMASFGQMSGPIDSFDIGDYPDQMQLIQQRLVPQQECNRGNDTIRLDPPRDVLCTRGLCGNPQIVKTFQQVCPGDSGSGVIGYFPEEDRYYLVGIASYTLSPTEEDCSKNTKPAVIISARFHRDFIYKEFSSPPLSIQLPSTNAANEQFTSNSDNLPSTTNEEVTSTNTNKKIFLANEDSLLKSGFINGTCYKVTNVSWEFRNISTGTSTECMVNCSSLGYFYAGIQGGSVCFCGNDEPPLSTVVDQEDCDMNCTGGAEQKCGGSNRTNVFQLYTDSGFKTKNSRTKVRIRTATRIEFKNPRSRITVN